jgi:nickel-dependent lactate racemase
MSVEVPVRLNRLLGEPGGGSPYDHILVCGPVFPHEVAGFSGGNKYFVPGVAGQEIIDITHWVGALMMSRHIIGVAETPVRRLIDLASELIPTPRSLIAMVMHGQSLNGLFIGDMEETWRKATELSADLDIVWVDRPFQRVLSVMPEMYDDLWTGAKGMYKLEPAIADGGEVVIYAPHITEVSHVHGHHLDKVGYHVRDYFTAQWERFKHIPWGVLAHSTHLRGDGTFIDGVEKARIRVTLATGIPKERCERIGLGYLDPRDVNFEEWKGRETEGIRFVPRAGEQLYRLKSGG